MYVCLLSERLRLTRYSCKYYMCKASQPDSECYLRAFQIVEVVLRICVLDLKDVIELAFHLGSHLVKSFVFLSSCNFVRGGVSRVVQGVCSAAVIESD